jgi:uncharacterized LabA/DUF88 family protein
MNEEEVRSQVMMRKIAILIDGDNANPHKIENILRETEKYGYVTIRRIYGDWTTPNMNSWKEHLHKYAFQPIQQFRYTVGKNSTDSCMIIDAMDILHSGLVNGFSLVSSDSDYTRLATRIREEGLFVMGIGEEKTPEAFVKACEIFIKTEIFDKKEEKILKKPNKIIQQKEKRTLLELLREAYEMCVGVDGQAYLSAIGYSLKKIDPSFDQRSYGFSQMLRLVESFPDEILVYKDPQRQENIKISFKEK